MIDKLALWWLSQPQWNRGYYCGMLVATVLACILEVIWR